MVSGRRNQNIRRLNAHDANGVSRLDVESVEFSSISSDSAVHVANLGLDIDVDASDQGRGAGRGGKRGRGNRGRAHRKHNRR